MAPLKPLVSFCFPSPPPPPRGREGEARAMAGLDIMPLQGQKSEKEGENVVVATVTPLGRVSQRYLRTAEGARAGITQPRASYSLGPSRFRLPTSLNRFKINVFS